jgi:hypothetical protein
MAQNRAPSVKSRRERPLSVSAAHRGHGDVRAQDQLAAIEQPRSDISGQDS